MTGPVPTSREAGGAPEPFVDAGIHGGINCGDGDRPCMKRISLLTVLAVVLLAVGAGIAYAATIEGGPGPDTLNGTPVRDTMFGYGGDDTMRGLGGTDTVQGGGDVLFGGPGADVLRGRGGDDNLFGGPDDTTESGNVDQFFCGPGYDVAHVEGPEHSEEHNLAGCEEVVNEEQND